MAITGRLAKGALDALGGKRYTGKKSTGKRAGDIAEVAFTGGTKGRRTGSATRNRTTKQFSGLSAGGKNSVGNDKKAAGRLRKGALGTAALAGVGAASALSDKGEIAQAKDTSKTKKQGQTAFEKAFRQARREGKKTFTFEGKKYTTDLRKPKQPSPRSKPKAPTKKAYGGKVMKRMGGGNTMYRKKGGSVGTQLVAACYKDKGVS